MGPIRAAELLPIVVTPYRFQNKRGFWSYCGLGVVMRSSSDWDDLQGCRDHRDRPGGGRPGLPANSSRIEVL